MICFLLYGRPRLSHLICVPIICLRGLRHSLYPVPAISSAFRPRRSGPPGRSLEGRARKLILFERARVSLINFSGPQSAVRPSSSSLDLFSSFLHQGKNEQAYSQRPQPFPVVCKDYVGQQKYARVSSRVSAERGDLVLLSRTQCRLKRASSSVLATTRPLRYFCGST